LNQWSEESVDGLRLSVWLNSKAAGNQARVTLSDVFAEFTHIGAAHHLRRIAMNLMDASVVESCYSLSERKLNAERENGLTGKS